MAIVTKQQSDFIQFLLVDPSLTNAQAAIKAGYSEKTSKSIANQLLNKPHVQAEIARRKADRCERTKVDEDYVVSELMKAVKMATGEMATINTVTVNGKKKKVLLHKTNLTALNKTLELLGRNVGMFTDKQELNISGSLEQTISDISKANAKERVSLLPKDNLDFGDE